MQTKISVPTARRIAIGAGAAMLAGVAGATAAIAAKAITADVVAPDKGYYSLTMFNERASGDKECTEIWGKGYYYAGVILDYPGNIKQKISYAWPTGFVCTFTPSKNTYKKQDGGAVEKITGKLSCEYKPDKYTFQANADLTLKLTQEPWGLQAILDADGTGADRGCSFTQNWVGVWAGK